MNNGTATDVEIPGSWLGAPHKYRIDWTATSVSFFVDGTLFVTQSVAIPSMRPIAASDFLLGGGIVTIDRLWMSPPIPPLARSSPGCLIPCPRQA